MNYPINLIKAYKAHEISRAELCRRYAALQGFDDTVRGYRNKYGTFITYRGRTARITNGLLVWSETQKMHKAKTIKEMKIKVDFYEQQEAKWI
ncbi:hypothetical protein EOM81_12655 [bacterium]|nr:hypothetical protein [bacterium]